MRSNSEAFDLIVAVKRTLALDHQKALDRGDTAKADQLKERLLGLEVALDILNG